MAITFTREILDALKGGGDIYEFGVFRGSSLRRIIELYNQHGIPFDTAWGFDSFVGLPKEADGVTPHPTWEIGAFNATTGHGEGEMENPAQHVFNMLSEIAPGKIQILVGFYDKLYELVRGYSTRVEKPASLIHIDCDLYISALQALDFMFNSRLVKESTVVRFDDMSEISDDQGERLAWRQICEKYEVNHTKLKTEHDNEFTFRINSFKETP